MGFRGRKFPRARKDAHALIEAADKSEDRMVVFREKLEKGISYVKAAIAALKQWR